MAKKTKTDKDRNTTVITVNKKDLKPFNELRAKETGRRGETVSQNEFIRFLMCLYKAADTAALDKAQKTAKEGRE